MKIDANTTQEQLLKLSEQVLRRDLLQSTPLNLKFFLRYLILFLLFPGMVFGFKLGMGITLGFCAVLVGVLFWGSEAASALAVYSWLSCGLLVLLFVTIGVIRKAWQERELRRQFRPAVSGLRHAQRAPQNYPLRWHKSNTEGFMAAHLVLQAPQRGLYALLISLKNYEGTQLSPRDAREPRWCMPAVARGVISMPLCFTAWKPARTSCYGLSRRAKRPKQMFLCLTLTTD